MGGKFCQQARPQYSQGPANAVCNPKSSIFTGYFAKIRRMRRPQWSMPVLASLADLPHHEA
jgi:hypothetical protein